MQNTLNLIPYLIVPFILPGISVLYRSFALILLSAVFVIQNLYLFLTPKRDSRPERHSPLYLAFTIVIFILLVSYNDDWMRHAVWPAIVSGGMTLLILSRTPVSVYAGLWLSAVVLWTMPLLHEGFAPLFPHTDFQELVARLVQVPQVVDGADVLLPDAIISPRDYSGRLIYHAAVICSTSLLFATAFLPRVRSSWFLRLPVLIVLFAWCAGSIVYLEENAFLLIGVNAILFTVFPHRFNKKRILWMGFIIAITIAGYSGYLIPLTSRMLQPAAVFDLPVQPFLIDPLLGDTPVRPYVFDVGLSSKAATATLLIGIGLTLILIERLRELSRRDAALPLCASILIFCAWSVGFSPVAVFSHPLFWLAMGSLVTSRIASPTSNAEYKATRYLTPVLVVLAVPMIVIAIYLLSCEWRAERQIRRFSESFSPQSRLVELETGFRAAPYRGDISSLYATTLVSIFLQEDTVPRESQLRELDKALQTCDRYRYLPLLAYKRLSDLFFRHSNSEGAIQVLRAGVRSFPERVVLHELLAECLDTLGRRKEALVEYMICVNLNPTSIHLRRKLALAYKHLGRNEDYELERIHLQTLDYSLQMN